jgi:hypothetical protein
MKPEVKKALDDWAKTTNLEIIQYYNISETKNMNNILEDLAEYIWDTAIKSRPKVHIHTGCAWKGKEGCCDAVVKARTQTAKEIFAEIDEKQIRLGYTWEEYNALKKKYGMK